MYHLTTSTTSLPVFPGHYPATPAKARSLTLQGDDLDDSDQQSICGEHSSPEGDGAREIKGAYSDNERYETAYSGEDTEGGLQNDSPDAPSLSLASTCSAGSLEPQSIVEIEGQDTSSISESDASTINRPAPSRAAVDRDATPFHFRMSDLSRGSEVLAGSPTATNPRHRTMTTSLWRNSAQCPSSLSLDVDLVGLPRATSDSVGRGVFLDGESDNSLHYYGVDLSCLSQPDGTNAWTLSLGATSPFPSISTSDDTPQTGFTPTFSSPDISTTTHEPESVRSSDADTSPSLSVDYGLESVVPTPEYGFDQGQVQSDSHYRDTYTDVYGEPSPPYEAESLVFEPIPYHLPVANVVTEEPRSHFKDVLGDMKKFGNKLKNIFKAKPQSGHKGKALVPRPMETTPEQQPEMGVDYYDCGTTAPTATSVQTILNRRGDYALRTPPGLLGYVEEVEEGDESCPVEQEATPRLAESRRKLLKPQTTAEIKHIRRRTLPAAPLSDDWPPAETASPIINVSQRRPRPRSLAFNTTPGSNPTLDTSYYSTSSAQSPFYEAASYRSAPSARSPMYNDTQLPADLAEAGVPIAVGGVGTARRRKRWSTGFAFFSRS